MGSHDCLVPVFGCNNAVKINQKPSRSTQTPFAYVEGHSKRRRIGSLKKMGTCTGFIANVYPLPTIVLYVARYDPYEANSTPDLDHFHVHIVNANYVGLTGMVVGQAHMLDDIISLVRNLIKCDIMVLTETSARA